MNLSEWNVDKKLSSRTNVEKNTMNLSEHLCLDKELFSGVYEGKYIHLLTIYKILIIKIYFIINQYIYF